MNQSPPLSNAHLLEILRIGHETSGRGASISMRQALAVTHYRKWRPTFTASDLVPLIRAHPDLIMQWNLYSQDKRTSGWALLRREIINTETQERVALSPVEELIAEYVVRELDFWIAVEDRVDHQQAR